MTEDASRPEIVGFKIPCYKNLRDAWLPWSEGVALFGTNGAGKTNLLECLALLLGSDQTLELLGARADHGGLLSVSVVARMPPAVLPWPPASVSRWLAVEDVRTMDLGHLPPLERARDDGIWWEQLGVSNGVDAVTGLAEATLPAEALDFVQGLFRAPVIRYSLLGGESSGLPGSRRVRRYSRTLVAGSIPDAVVAVAEELPDLFGPLRSAIATPSSDDDPWIDVLELSPSSEAPAVIQWLPRSRASSEANDSLVTAFGDAAGPAVNAGRRLTPFRRPDLPRATGLEPRTPSRKP